MTREQQFFLQILSDHMAGRKTEARSELEWAALCTYAANHQCNGIVYHQCRSFLPAPVEKVLSEKYAAELYYYANRIVLFRQVCLGLSAKEIPFVSVKGMEIASLYPVPALRTMGDCDLVVQPKDKDRANEVMLSLGFQIRSKEEIEWMYIKNNMEFEIHDRLLYDKPTNDRSSLALADQVWNYVRPTGEGSRYALDWSFHFLFLLLHLKKHLIGTGVGFRQFADLAVVARKCELDREWLEKTLEAQNLLTFARTCSALMERWFGEPLPLEPLELDDTFFEEATQRIFCNGIFGFHDEKNRENSKLNAITQKKGPRWLIRLRNLLGSVFPPYRVMRYVPHYRFLDGRPWLLPAAWIYRFYRSVRYRLGSRGKQMIQDTMISNKRLDERKKELGRWGLKGPDD